MRGSRIASHQPSLYMPLFPTASKYCWVCRSGAPASASESANVKPCSGSCSIPSTCVGAGAPQLEHRRGDVDHVREVLAQRARIGDPLRVVDDERIPRPAEVGGDLLPQSNGQLLAHAQAAE